MRTILALLLILSPTLAQAHPGHLADVAGHDHWVAGIALGAAIGAAVWGWLKGGDEPATASSDEDQMHEADA